MRSRQPPVSCISSISWIGTAPLQCLFNRCFPKLSALSASSQEAQSPPASALHQTPSAHPLSSSPILSGVYRLFAKRFAVRLLRLGLIGICPTTAGRLPDAVLYSLQAIFRRAILTLCGRWADCCALSSTSITKQSILLCFLLCPDRFRAARDILWLCSSTIKLSQRTLRCEKPWRCLGKMTTISCRVWRRKTGFPVHRIACRAISSSGKP